MGLVVTIGSDAASATESRSGLEDRSGGLPRATKLLRADEMECVTVDAG